MDRARALVCAAGADMCRAAVVLGCRCGYSAAVVHCGLYGKKRLGGLHYQSGNTGSMHAGRQLLASESRRRKVCSLAPTDAFGTLLRGFVLCLEWQGPGGVGLGMSHCAVDLTM